MAFAGNCGINVDISKMRQFQLLQQSLSINNNNSNNNIDNVEDTDDIKTKKHKTFKTRKLLKE